MPHLLHWPSIVQLAADYAAAIHEYATADPLRAQYADLLLALMQRPSVQANRPVLDNLCDRFERVLGIQ